MSESCCDMHNRHCEQGGDECCENCTEAHHFEILPPHGDTVCVMTGDRDGA